MLRIQRGWLILAMTCGLWGCAMIRSRSSDPLPQKQSFVLGQLIVHSDFPLPENHRLLEELRLEREEVFTRLALPQAEEPVHVYLFENEERFRGFIAERYPRFPDRRAFFLQSDTRLVVFAHWGDRVAEDLRHEVSHGYMHSAVPRIPLWLDEGLAEYFEVPHGHRGLNRAHLDYLLGELLPQGWQPDLVRLESLSSPSDMTQADYAEAWAWANFLLENDTLHRQLLQEHLDQVRREGNAVPLNVRLRQRLPNAPVLLMAHLQQLRNAQQTAGK